MPGTHMTNPGGAVPRRIALVEDDADIAYTIRLNLRKHGWQVDHFVSGLRALEALEEKPYDLVILDLNLPDVDGLAVARELRQHEETKRISILMLTARVEERDKLLGFDVGADDYLTKPFSMKELVARVSAHLRRAGSNDAAEDDVYATTGLRIDRPRFEVEVEGRPVRLTKREFDLLWYLVRNRSRVVTRDTILARLWGYDADVETRTVDVHIRSLRRKLGDRWIDTVVGVGYRFVEPRAEG
jgi:two-component system, OmpR family, alkaline phosphatase synthesis response regulator PhoP